MTRGATTSGFLEHPAPNLEPGDVVELAALLDVVFAPSRLDTDDTLR